MELLSLFMALSPNLKRKYNDESLGRNILIRL